LPSEQFVGSAVDDTQVLRHVRVRYAFFAQQQHVDLCAIAVEFLEQRLDALKQIKRINSMKN
jgi:hypothetical protein